MSLWEKLIALRNVLNYGEKLKDSATWKDRATLSNIFAGLLACIIPFIPQFSGFDQSEIRDLGFNLGWGAYAVFSLYNAYLHTATSDSVGFGKSRNHP